MVDDLRKKIKKAEKELRTAQRNKDYSLINKIENQLLLLYRKLEIVEQLSWGKYLLQRRKIFE